MQYHGTIVSLHRHQYHNGRVALQLRDATTGEPLATATINIPEEDLGANEAIIKDYSENEGTLAWLVENGIVEDTGRRVSVGPYLTAPVVKLKPSGV